MAIELTKTYPVPGFLLIGLLGLGGAEAIIGTYQFAATAEAKPGVSNPRVEVDLSASGKACVVGVIKDEFCPAIEEQIGLPDGACTLAKVLKYKQSNIDLNAADRDDPPDGVAETVVMGARFSLPDSRTVTMP